jgi:hypothetical protein
MAAGFDEKPGFRHIHAVLAAFPSNHSPAFGTKVALP